MTYGMNDVKQAILGVTVAILFIYILRSGQPININPVYGLIFGLIWVYIASSPFINGKRETKVHATGNIIIAVIISSILSLMFNMVTTEQLFSFHFFGSSAWLIALIGITSAQFYDAMNINNMYERWYFRRRR